MDSLTRFRVMGAIILRVFGFEINFVFTIITLETYLSSYLGRTDLPAYF